MGMDPSQAARAAGGDAATGDGDLTTVDSPTDDGAIAETLDAAEADTLDEAGTGSETQEEAGAEAGDAPVSVVEDLARGLVLWLPFDEPAGSLIAGDHSGQGNRAGLRDVDPALAWVAGRVGGALDLGAAAPGAGHVRVESSPALNRIGNELSIAAWLWRASGQPGVILSRRATAASGTLYGFSIEADGHLRLLLNDRRGVRLNLRSTLPLPTGRWVHAAMACDRRAARLYVDGTAAGEAPYGVPFAPEVSPLLIGASQSASTVVNFLPERLDDLLVYQRALTGPEMSALANGARPPSVEPR
jgi:hypothetical protein